MTPSTLKSRGASDSRETLLAAAGEEFARTSFDGASVDAIAVRAGLTKAMVYYHFQNKQGLYLELVRAGFSAIGARTDTIVNSRATAEEKMVAFVAAISAEADAREYLAPIMTREMADGARHLDPETLRLMSQVFRALGLILEQGVREAIFREVDPFFAFHSIIGPIINFRTSQPLRAAMSKHRVVEGAAAHDRDLFLAHHTSQVLRGLAVDLSKVRELDRRLSRSR